MTDNINLPTLPNTTIPVLGELESALKIPSGILASPDDISHAWDSLPRELADIPVPLRNETIAKLCVAISVGLFDSAINYIWNATILNLREKVRIFGLRVIAQIRQTDFEEKHLAELQDSKLLELCLEINIINEEGYFYLDQCRALRNNYSAAHPNSGNINDRELTNFINRCVRIGLQDSPSPKGIDINDFIHNLINNKFTQHQLDIWTQRLGDTHEAQRNMLVSMIHGIYCDPKTPEQSRLNVIDLCNSLQTLVGFSSTAKSNLINENSDYKASGKEDRLSASYQFFEKLNLIELLQETDTHYIISRAIQRLWNTHNGFDNFYNEPAFAERLLELTLQTAVPDTAKDQFVHVVACCRIGNGYGISRGAQRHYDEMIKNFSPKEIDIMLHQASDHKCTLGYRISLKSSFHRNFLQIIRLIDPHSVPNRVKSKFNQFINQIHEGK